MLQTNAEINIAIAAATAFLFLLAGLTVSLMLLYQRKQQINRKEKESLQSYYQQELLRTQLEIQEQTFKTISQEIHDNIGQMLSLAKLNLNRIDTSNLGSDLENVHDTKELIGKSIQDLRDLSKTLNTDNISRTGLIKAVELELQLLEKTGSVDTRILVEGNPIRMDPQKELILFRICQEALHNIIKHAHANIVEVVFSFNEFVFYLELSDDGVGFNPANDNSLGSGLRNMKNRAKLIGANLSITSIPEQGTRIKVELPLNQ